MRDVVPRIHAAGGELVIVGNGQPEHARWFIEDFGVQTPVYTNPDRALYDAVGAARGIRLSRLPQLAWSALRAMRRGHRQTQTMGDARQLGGTFVIAPGDRVVYRYLSRDAGDHPRREAPVEALERFQASGAG